MLKNHGSGALCAFSEGRHNSNQFDVVGGILNRRNSAIQKYACFFQLERNCNI
jgi:hypothetical protein